MPKLSRRLARAPSCSHLFQARFHYNYAASFNMDISTRRRMTFQNAFVLFRVDPSGPPAPLDRGGCSYHQGVSQDLAACLDDQQLSFVSSTSGWMPQPLPSSRYPYSSNTPAASRAEYIRLYERREGWPLINDDFPTPATHERTPSCSNLFQLVFIIGIARLQFTVLGGE
ncbi:hypothetical protein FA13DRAFT_516113 [Coprinellus micaceus]|uniref:Uncharacterized protein n=1 Tax=Coprinellus micaceus TaxID=71717 RepID=A0A4Y7SBA1_COPMI|nr:hypothetical protein FA13DRAFT_516113 [Coprinellus micaceus]